MKRIYLLFCLAGILVFSSETAQSQDLHWTNNSVIPTYYNPAQTGAYAGTYRAGLILRDQWRQISSTPYTSAALFVDSPIIFGFSKQHWVGVGATLFYDRAGEVEQTWSGFYPSVSYHIGLDKKLRNVITIGAQYGAINRGLSNKDLRLEDETLGIIAMSPDRMAFQNAEKGIVSLAYSDLNVGLLFKSNLDKFSRFEIGGSYMHVLNPGITYGLQGGKNKIGSRINVHTKYRRASNRRMIWEPSAYFSSAPGASIIQLQLRNEFLLKKKGDISLIAGLGFRVGDSVQLLTGANYKDWIISFSYDYVISGLTESGIVAAYELGVSKIFVVNKKPKVKPIIYCPRL